MSRGVAPRRFHCEGRPACHTEQVTEARRASSEARLGALLSRAARSGVAEATLATLLLLYSEVFFGTDTHPLSWTQFIVDSVVCVGAAVSGRWPRAGGVVTGVGLAALPLVHTAALPAAIFAALIPLFATGARGLMSWRTGLAVVYFILLNAATIRVAHNTAEAAQSLVIWIIMITLVWLLGTVLNTLRRRMATLAGERAEAVRNQRRTIARDLHDTVAYATTTMIMRAEELKLRGTHPELDPDLDFIIATGRRSLRDLRGMMEALRRNDPTLEVDPAEAPWRIVSLDALIPQQVAELRAHGLTVDLQIDADVGSLPDSVRETLGKLVVEATSNMVKHAERPGPCRIIIEQTPGTVEAVFTNPIGTTASGSSGGFGLLGARERVEALGGDFETTAASGTWLLRVALPVGE